MKPISDFGKIYLKLLYKYQSDQLIHWDLITAQTKVPSLCKLAFERIPDSKSGTSYENAA